MSRTFTETAPRLCALAARTLGWRPDEFWRATPAELADCLGLTADAAGTPASTGIDRDTLTQMMDNDHGR
ncbi:phage tail assembly chaperone [Novosphingobium sp. 9]|uniref:phage tail assembly chaperone n=1 Tax=Novosphingobium sp. 9 TaxID=2025349 RepID=UPI0021B5D131|nr:phage tail assembly chaperone [Novosphingobium sp. 9]